MRPISDGPDTSAVPDGPWVLVVGMHRSGTSAVTGVLGGLGLQMPSVGDRIKSSASNPEHWESHSLMLLNESLLEQCGGTWDAPPPPLGPSAVRPIIGDIGDPGSVMAGAFPAPGPVAWKDPRLSLLLPIWRPLLPAPLAVVLVWRHPLAVARSLRQRDHMSLARGVALWERYNVIALEGMRGLDSYVIDYDALMDDLEPTVAGLGDWLRSLEQFAPHLDPIDEASSRVVDALHHQRSDDDDQVLLPEQRHLLERLVSLAGPHRSFDPGSSIQESAWTSEILASRLESHGLAVEGQRLGELLVEAEGFAESYQRNADAYRLKAEAYRQQLDADRNELDHQRELLAQARMESDKTERMIANMRASTSWRMTRPVRQVVGKFADRSGRSK